MRPYLIHATLFVLLAAGTASATCIGDKLAPLVLDIQANKAAVRNAAANSKILLIGYGRSWDPQRHASRFVRYRSFITADAGGASSVEFRNGFTADSVFAAVDLDTGRCGTVALSSEPGKERQAAFDRTAIKEVNGRPKKVVVALPRGYLVVIRAGTGVWDLLAGDGSAVDDDQSINGVVSFDVGRLQPA
jgi:hypothetical protein